MMTVFAENMGVISVCAYGVRSKKSKLRAAAQPLCFCEFVLSKKQGDIYRVEAAEILDSFYPISEDIVKLSLANYLCELSRETFVDGDNSVLSLLLNTLYVMAYKNVEPLLAKAVFELKLAQYSGYEPVLDACIGCGQAENLVAFDFSGGLKCSSCRREADMNIDVDLYHAIKYIITANDKKIFSFNVSEQVRERLSLLAEGYILNKSERSYKSLDYFKKMI